MAWDIGDTYSASVVVKDPEGEPVNADNVTLQIILPNGEPLDPAPVITNPPAETGNYSYDYVIQDEGRHVIKWTTVNPNTAYVDVFDVRPATPVHLVSLADMKSALTISSTAYDEDLRTLIEAATHAIEKHVNETITIRSFTEVARLAPHAALVHYPVVSLTSVEDADTGATYDVTGGIRDHKNGIIGGGSLPRQARVRVTYKAGMQVIPANYIEAAKIIVLHLWSTRRGPAGARATTGPLGINEFHGYAIPHAAMELLGKRGPVVG